MDRQLQDCLLSPGALAAGQGVEDARGIEPRTAAQRVDGIAGGQSARLEELEVGGGNEDLAREVPRISMVARGCPPARVEARKERDDGLEARDVAEEAHEHERELLHHFALVALSSWPK